jgi:hypothetical protein
MDRELSKVFSFNTWGVTHKGINGGNSVKCLIQLLITFNSFDRCLIGQMGHPLRN